MTLVLKSKQVHQLPLRGEITHVVTPEQNPWTPGFTFTVDRTQPNAGGLISCSLGWCMVKGDPRKIKVGTRGTLIAALEVEPYFIMVKDPYLGEHPAYRLFKPDSLMLKPELVLRSKR